MTRPVWLMAAAALLVGCLPLVAVVVRAPAIDGAVAVQLGGALTTLVLICLAAGLHQSSFADLALVAAFCSVVSGLAFARFLDREP